MGSIETMRNLETFLFDCDNILYLIVIFFSVIALTDLFHFLLFLLNCKYIVYDMF